MAEADEALTSRPAIAVGGIESPSLTRALLRISVRADVQGLSNCEVEFADWEPGDHGHDFLSLARSEADLGKEIEVRLADREVFTGAITGIGAIFPEAGAPSSRVLAEARFQDMRMTRRTRTLANVADAEVFSTLAIEHGLTPDVSVTGPPHHALEQIDKSDLAFLHERARDLGAELRIDGATLKVTPGSSPVALTYGQQLRQFRVLAQPGGGETLPSRGEGPLVLGHGTASVLPELWAGVTVHLAGLGLRFQGDFYVRATTLLFDAAGGLRTELEVERPGLG